MRSTEDFEVQVPDPLAEHAEYMRQLTADPEHAEWSAKLEGEFDCDAGIPLTEGERKLTERGASAAEVTGYRVGYAREVVAKIARDSGIPMPSLAVAGRMFS